jgi:hypothetical protein
MIFRRRRVALLSALSVAALIGSLGGTAIPASAVTAAPQAVAVSASYGVVCSGALCIQTQSVNINTCQAVIYAWANTSFTGHFDMAIPSYAVLVHDPPAGNIRWSSGEKAMWEMPFYGQNVSYQATAWKHTTTYYDIGRVDFTINVPSFCTPPI